MSVSKNDRIFKFENKPAILSIGTVAGKKEWDGALGGIFDSHCEDDTFGMPTWEQAESEMQRMALNHALAKLSWDSTDLGLLFAGDLINQCTSSGYGLIDFDVPFMGLFGACSTLAEGLILTAFTVDAGYVNSAAAITSSHNCSSERQFRFPVEYGGQRTPTAQWTVTGAGAYIVGRRSLYDIDEKLKTVKNTPPGQSSPIFSHVRIAEAMPGRTMECGITDSSNMGAAMAPAAADTLLRYFTISGMKPDDFDLIVTGDLAFEGHRLAAELLSQKGIHLGSNFGDCGLMIYDRERQDMHAGGSGCGCSAIVMGADIIPKIDRGELRNVLFIATGALMSPMSVQQGLPIPAIGHLVRLVHE